MLVKNVKNVYGPNRQHMTRVYVCLWVYHSQYISLFNYYFDKNEWLRGKASSLHLGNRNI